MLAGADVTLQSVPVSPSDETVRDRCSLVAQRERLEVHHITVQHLDDRLALALDLELDGALPLADAHATADRLEARSAASSAATETRSTSSRSSRRPPR